MAFSSGGDSRTTLGSEEGLLGALRWRVRALAYLMLRLLLAIPHLLVLAFILLAWGFTTIVAWFMILFTPGPIPRDLTSLAPEYCVGGCAWKPTSF